MTKEWVQDGRMFDWLTRFASYVENAPSFHKQTVLVMIQRFATVEGMKGNTTVVDVPLVLEVMHSTMVHNLKYKGSANSVGDLNCRLAIDIPKMIKMDWASRGQSDAGFNVEEAFKFYMGKMKMDPEKLHPVQLRETRRAFFGGVSTYLRMLTDTRIHTMEEAMSQLQGVEQQCREFWESESKGAK